MKLLFSNIKEYYPVIVLLVILFFLLIDLQNYQTLIIFSNVFGFSFISNNLIKKHYKSKIICVNSLYALNLINAINIVGCFFDYEYYIKILIIVTIVMVLSISIFKIKWQKK